MVTGHLRRWGEPRRYSVASVTVLCLGEAIVDLVCEHPVNDPSEARAFVPHCGGAVANAAVVAARGGADVNLAGGVGDDAWGRWLEERLRKEGVGLRWFRRISGLATPLAFVFVDDQGEPSFNVYGHGIEAGVESLAGDLGKAVGAARAVALGSNTLVGETEREISLEARRLAVEQGKPFVFDPNLRLHRWPDEAGARELMRKLCDGALLVKVNGEEASFITGENEPGRAAEFICALGASVAVVTLGPHGALARGESHADVPGISARVIDATGAGDVVTGVLIAALAEAAFETAAVAAALPAAVEAASRSTEGWGAVDALPPLGLPNGR
jgi:sugar/nucleoside kinase (ribokinase family)